MIHFVAVANKVGPTIVWGMDFQNKDDPDYEPNSGAVPFRLGLRPSFDTLSTLVTKW
jgi:hypothetical protein